MNFSQKELQRIVADLDTHDITIKTHAIGDRTNREVLNAYEKVISRRGGNPLRHHLGHLTTVHPQDFPRLRQLDVPGEFIGNVAALIPYVERSYYPALGHDRFHTEMEPVAGLLAAGAILNASSDWGAAILDPMRSIQTVITRRDPHNPEGQVAGPEHRVDLPTAIALHTINGAYVTGRERQTGSLEVGKQADLIVLDRNLFEIPAEEIRHTRVLLTLIGGKTAWKDRSFEQ
jgi:predicted amidohydrolase YtcJ